MMKKGKLCASTGGEKALVLTAKDETLLVKMKMKKQRGIL
jgi:hypothetical protein